jgi:NADH:ubiquinone oxidoreductase subunit 4 (subunit M)
VTVLLFAIGVYPRWLLKPMEPSVLAALQSVKGAAVTERPLIGGRPLATAQRNR